MNTPFALNFFPHGEGKAAANVLSLDNAAVALVAFYKDKTGYVLRLVNNGENAQKVTVKLMGKEYPLSFGKYEAKTYVFDGEKLVEKPIWV